MCVARLRVKVQAGPILEWVLIFENGAYGRGCSRSVAGCSSNVMTLLLPRKPHENSSTFKRYFICSLSRLGFLRVFST